MGEFFNNWVVPVIGLLLLWQQNRIFVRQNEIFAEQSTKKAKPMPSETSATRTRIRRYWPMIAMSILVLLTWVGVFVNYEQHHRYSLPEFDQPESEPLVLSYGGGDDFCYMSVMGKKIYTYSSKYKVTIACFIWDGTGDALDVPMDVGSAHDIMDHPIPIRLNYSQTFLAYLRTNHISGTRQTALLLVPSDVPVTQFSTLRQARAMGVHIPDAVTSGTSMRY